MTDQELIEGLSAKDRTAINYLVNTYQKRVIKTAYYFIGNLEDAEDLSQEIFLEIIRSEQFQRQFIIFDLAIPDQSLTGQ